MKKFLLLFLIVPFFASGQCTYPGGTSVGTYFGCIDLTVQTANVAAGNYVLVNVISGFNYTFSVGDINTTENENLTLFDISNNFLAGGYNSGTTAATITWTSTISGQIKILFSRGACLNSGGNSGPISLKINSVGNNVDTQTTSLTDKWRGHIYNWTGGIPPGGASPSAPANTTPFSNAEYAGYYDTTSETINEGFGGDNACFNVFSNGVQRASIYTDKFAVRYRMNSTKTGCYFLNVNGDDGVRVYVDNVLVLNQWKDQGNTFYCNNLIRLTGTSEIIFDYYENVGGNVAGFSLTAFDGSTNTIASSKDVRVCSNVSPGILDGSNFGNCNGGTNSIYQWQLSTDNITFNDIAGATTEDYTPPTVTTTTTNNTRYFRRVLKASASNASACSYPSVDVVKVTTSPGIPTTPGTITGSQSVCKSSSSTYSIAAVANALSYTWSTTETGWTITPAANGLSVSIAFSTAATSGNLQVTASNGCGTSNSASLNIQLGDVPTAAKISGTTTVCIGASQPNLVFTNPQAYGVNVTYTINGGTNQIIYVNANTTSSLGAPTTTAGTFVYSLVSVANGVGFPSCSSAISGSATVTVSAAPYGPTLGTITQPTCSTATGSVALSGLPSTGTWALTRSGASSATTTGSGVSTTISGLSPGTFMYTVEKANVGTGLKGEYFNNMTFTGTPTLTRIDATVNLNVGTGSPDPSINSDNFSVRWTGQIQPLYSETYTFTTVSDDGIRLSVNGTLIINNFTNHGPVSDSATITLIAGVKYNILLEYFENTGGAIATLSWNSPSQASQIIPQSQLYPIASCSSVSPTTVVINTQPVTPAAPTTTILTQPDCVTPTGTFKIANYNPSYTYTFSPAAGITNSGDTVTASPGGYTITASIGACTSVVSATVTINNPIITTYNGSTWSVTPTIKMTGTISSNTPINTDVDLCSCTVNAGITASVASGKTLRLQDKLVVNGTLTFENNASLVQISDGASNSGLIYYKRNTKPVRRYDFTYWSSPVFGQTLKDLSPDTLGDKYYSFDAVNNSYIIIYNGSIPTMPSMEVGSGYLVRAPQYFDITTPAIDTNPTFIGKPNNGILTSSLVGDKLYLLGNPYPSALDANAFLIANSGKIEGTLYFWTHNSSPNTNNYTSNDYATYNQSGGTGTSPGVNVPLGKIAAGQGFFAPASASGGTLTFNNSMRVGYDTTVAVPANSNSQFFRPSATSKSAAEIERNRLWIDLTNAQGAFKETLLGYITGATNGYDSAFDGESFDGNAYIDFYSINSDKNLTIQGRALPFDASETVPLGYRSTIEGEFSIGIRDRDGFFTTQKVYLEDKLLGTVFDLTATIYNFNTAVGVFNDRFALKYMDQTLGVGDIDPISKGIYIATKNKTITIKSSDEPIDKIFVYDFAGKQLYKKIAIDANQVSISGLPAGDVALIVKVVLKDGVTVTQKIIY